MSDLGDRRSVDRHDVDAGADDRARLVTSNTPFEYVDGSERRDVDASSPPVSRRRSPGPGHSGVAVGTADVTATYGDKTGINPIRVLPDYTGNWSGDFVVTGCTGGHRFPRVRRAS